MKKTYDFCVMFMVKNDTKGARTQSFVKVPQLLGIEAEDKETAMEIAKAKLKIVAFTEEDMGPAVACILDAKKGTFAGNDFRVVPVFHEFRDSRLKMYTNLVIPIKTKSYNKERIFRETIKSFLSDGDKTEVSTYDGQYCARIFSYSKKRATRVFLKFEN